MPSYAINPPNTPLVDAKGHVKPEWYRYFVRNKAQGDGATDAPVITFGSATSIFPNSRALQVASGELTETAGGSNVTLGLEDSGVTAGTYGAATKLVVLAIDAKGRVTAASEITLNSDNVTEGASNLYFTNARARGAVSGGSGISYNGGTGVFTLDQAFTRGLLSSGSGINYNNGTGVIATTGFTGTKTPPASITVVNGIVTNMT